MTRAQLRNGRISHLPLEYAPRPEPARRMSLWALPVLVVVGAVYWLCRAIGGRRR
jgi:hypothetical protein